jgi:hypothetical protein
MKGGWCHREKNIDISLYINITLKTRSSIWYREGISRWIKKNISSILLWEREARDRHFFMNWTSTKKVEKIPIYVGRNLLNFFFSVLMKTSFTWILLTSFSANSWFISGYFYDTILKKIMFFISGCFYWIPCFSVIIVSSAFHRGLHIHHFLAENV